MKIVGFTGRKFHGKDTAAKKLINDEGYIHLSFAEPIKQISKILFSFDDEQLYGNKREVIDERWKITPREAMQYLGTEIFREKIQELIPDIGVNFWVRSVQNKISKLKVENPDVKIVITDVRFQNELDMIREFGGKVIRVKRNIDNGINQTHASEIYIDTMNVDYEIENNGTIEELHDKVKNLQLF